MKRINEHSVNDLIDQSLQHKRQLEYTGMAKLGMVQPREDALQASTRFRKRLCHLVSLCCRRDDSQGGSRGWQARLGLPNLPYNPYDHPPPPPSPAHPACMWGWRHAPITLAAASPHPAPCLHVALPPAPTFVKPNESVQKSNLTMDGGGRPFSISQFFKIFTF